MAQLSQLQPKTPAGPTALLIIWPKLHHQTRPTKLAHLLLGPTTEYSPTSFSFLTPCSSTSQPPPPSAVRRAAPLPPLFLQPSTARPPFLLLLQTTVCRLISLASAAVHPANLHARLPRYRRPAPPSLLSADAASVHRLISFLGLSLSWSSAASLGAQTAQPSALRFRLLSLLPSPPPLPSPPSDPAFTAVGISVIPSLLPLLSAATPDLPPTHHPPDCRQCRAVARHSFIRRCQPNQTTVVAQPPSAPIHSPSLSQPSTPAASASVNHCLVLSPGRRLRSSFLLNRPSADRVSTQAPSLAGRSTSISGNHRRRPLPTSISPFLFGPDFLLKSPQSPHLFPSSQTKPNVLFLDSTAAPRLNQRSRIKF